MASWHRGIKALGIEIGPFSGGPLASASRLWRPDRMLVVTKDLYPGAMHSDSSSRACDLYD